MMFFLLTFLLASAFCAKSEITTTAYNCQNALVKETKRYDGCFTCPLIENTCSSWEINIAFLLARDQVVFTYGLFSDDIPPNMIIVAEGKHTFEVTCPPELVTIVPTVACYADDVSVISLNGQQKYMDRNKFIITDAVQIPCNGKNIKHKIVDKIRDHNLRKVGSDSISFAMLKDNRYFDATKLMSNKTIEKLIFFEECHANGDFMRDHLSSYMLFYYRMWSGKIQLSFWCFKIIYCITFLKILK